MRSWKKKTRVQKNREYNQMVAAGNYLGHSRSRLGKKRLNRIYKRWARREGYIQYADTFAMIQRLLSSKHFVRSTQNP